MTMIEVQNKDGRKIFTVDVGDMSIEEVKKYLSDHLGREISFDKENNEDALLVTKIQEAPERKVFYIDIKNMSPKEKEAYWNRVKKGFEKGKDK